MRALDKSLSRSSRLLAELGVRALVTPLSSVAAERAGSYLRKLGAGKDRNRMGERALSDNMYMWANSDYADKVMALAGGRAQQDRELSQQRPETNHDDRSPDGSSVTKLRPAYNKHDSQAQERGAASAEPKTTAKLVPQPELTDVQRMRKADEAKRGFNALFGMTKTGPKPSESSVLPSTKTGDVNDKDSRVQQQQQLPQLSQQREVGINDENITMIRDEASKTTTALCRKRTVRSAIIYVDDEEEEEEE